MFPIQELPTNEHRAIVISQLFGVQLPTRYNDKQWRKLIIKLVQYGYHDIETKLNINHQTHEAWIKTYESSYGFNFTHYIPQDKKGLVKALVDDLYQNDKASFDELAFKHNLMTNLESLAYKSEQEHQQKHGNKPVPVHHKYSINDLIK